MKIESKQAHTLLRHRLKVQPECQRKPMRKQGGFEFLPPFPCPNAGTAACDSSSETLAVSQFTSQTNDLATLPSPVVLAFSVLHNVSIVLRASDMQSQPAWAKSDHLRRQRRDSKFEHDD